MHTFFIRADSFFSVDFKQEMLLFTSVPIGRRSVWNGWRSIIQNGSKDLTGQLMSLTDYLCHNNETSFCPAGLSFSNSRASVCSVVLSASRAPRWMKTLTESEDNNRVKPDTVAKQRSGWFGLVLNDRMAHTTTISGKCVCALRPLKVWGLSFFSARYVSYHISSTALFLACRVVTRLEKAHSRGGEWVLFYLWFSPNSYKRSPSHVLSGATHASRWQCSRCLWRFTKADFDIWDDKEAHTLRSLNRHFNDPRQSQQMM